MIIIKYLSTIGTEVCEHHLDSNSLKEAEAFVENQFKNDKIIASCNNGKENTVFERKYVAGYKLILREKSKVTMKPF